MGLSGPEQTHEIPLGGSVSSYLRVWNEGSSEGKFAVQVLGEVESMVDPDPISFTLGPGEQRTISLIYSVPGDMEPGSYSGIITARFQGDISSQVSRDIEVAVKGQVQDGGQLSLRKGLNLIGWFGENLSFSEALDGVDGPKKIWRRKPDGSYTSAEYYPSVGVWWSSDSQFTGLKNGKAYFVECEKACTINLNEMTDSGPTKLEKGTNLIVWKWGDAAISEAFPQEPSQYEITKIWRSGVDGEYEFTQYYPSADLWWSETSSFTELERGKAYFVEVLAEMWING